MDKRDALRKELERMAEKQKALERELAMTEEEEKKKESGNKGIGIDFSDLPVWIRNYSFAHHFMKDRKGDEDYIRLLILTALMMQPYTEHLDEGLAFIDQVQNVLGGQSVEELTPEVMEIDRKGMEKIIASVRRSQGTQPFLIDSLLLYGEMKKGEDKAEVTRQLSSLYGLLGADEKLVVESADAVDFIEKGDKEGLQKAAETWEELQPALALAYLGCTFKEKAKPKTSYMAVWPKRLDTVDASVCPTYANNVILKTMVDEGDAVDVGDVLFVIYGGKQKYKRDIGGLHKYDHDDWPYWIPDPKTFRGHLKSFDSLYYDKQKKWMYIGTVQNNHSWMFIGMVQNDASPALIIDDNYEEVTVKAECRGIVHYSNDICNLPFQDISSDWHNYKGVKCFFDRNDDPHIHAINETLAQPTISQNEYFRSGSLLKLDNIFSSVICTITPVE